MSGLILESTAGQICIAKNSSSCSVQTDPMDDFTKDRFRDLVLDMEVFQFHIELQALQESCSSILINIVFDHDELFETPHLRKLGGKGEGAPVSDLPFRRIFKQ
jgi:hypothetical protein